MGFFNKDEYLSIIPLNETSAKRWEQKGIKIVYNNGRYYAEVNAFFELFDNLINKLNKFYNNLDEEEDNFKEWKKVTKELKSDFELTKEETLKIKNENEELKKFLNNTKKEISEIKRDAELSKLNEEDLLNIASNKIELQVNDLFIKKQLEKQAQEMFRIAVKQLTDRNTEKFDKEYQKALDEKQEKHRELIEDTNKNIINLEKSIEYQELLLKKDIKPKIKNIKKQEAKQKKQQSISQQKTQISNNFRARY